MVECILKIKTSIEAVAQECVAIFGEGGFIPTEEQPECKFEKYLGYVNTPLLNGYCRVKIGEYFGQALEYISENGGSVNADLVRVEWPNEDGYEPFTVEVENFDINGNPDGTRMQSIGSF